MNDKVRIGRLAMRHEGDFWNAYYALDSTMAGALLLGSIKMGLVSGNPRRRTEANKTAFINLMREAVADIIQEQIGVRPVWGDIEAAPESERAGHG